MSDEDRSMDSKIALSLLDMCWTSLNINSFIKESHRISDREFKKITRGKGWHVQYDDELHTWWLETGVRFVISSQGKELKDRATSTFHENTISGTPGMRGRLARWDI